MQGTVPSILGTARHTTDKQTETLKASYLPRDCQYTPKRN